MENINRTFTSKITLMVILLIHWTIGRWIKYPHHSQITDNLFLGALPMHNLDQARQFGRRGLSVLSMVELEEYQPSLLARPVKPEEWADRCNFLHVPTVDRCEIADRDLETALEFIQSEQEQGRTVYVHCKAGMGRAATVVIAYLMRHFQLRFDEAHALVSQKRWIGITPAQRAQLMRFEHKLIGSKQAV